MLPAKLVRRRIAIQLSDHLDWLRELYEERGFTFGPTTTEPAEAPPEQLLAWRARDFEAQYEPPTAEGRPLELLITWRNLPSPIARTKTDQITLGYEHRFAVVLPPSYPSSLQMRLVNLTPTLHPRMLPPDREAPACIFPNADLDGTLREMLWNLLFRPDMVRPPELFDEEDAGFRPSEMKWYTGYGPQRLHDELLAAWYERQASLTAEEESAASQPVQPTKPTEPKPATAEQQPAQPFRIVGEPQEKDDTPPMAPPFRIAGED